MRIRPYILYKNNELNSIKQIVHNGLIQWGAAWGHSSEEFHVELIEASALLDMENEFKAKREAPQYTRIKLDDEHWCVCEISVENKKRLLSMLLNEPPDIIPKRETGIVVDELLKRAMQDLFARFFIKTPGPEDITIDTIVDIPASPYQAGSGSLAFKVHFREMDLMFVISGAVLLEHIAEKRKLQRREGGLSKFGVACAHHDVPVHLKIGTAEVKLEDVMSLEVGDVLTLDQKISDPAKLVISKETVEHQCLLGKVGTTKAVRLLAK